MAIYLSGIAICAVVFGLLVDQLYAALGISARAMVGQASEAIPFGVELAGAVFILILSIKPVGRFLRSRFSSLPSSHTHDSHPHVGEPISPPEHCSGST